MDASPFAKGSPPPESAPMHPDVARHVLNFAFAKALVVLGINAETPLSRKEMAQIVSFLRQDSLVLKGICAATAALGACPDAATRTTPRWFKQPAHEEDFNFRERPSLAHLRQTVPDAKPKPFVSKRGGPRTEKDAHYARAEIVASKLLTEYHQKRRLSRMQAIPSPADMPSQTPGPFRSRVTPRT